MWNPRAALLFERATAPRTLRKVHEAVENAGRGLVSVCETHHSYDGLIEEPGAMTLTVGVF
jgi:hypothetical protein